MMRELEHGGVGEEHTLGEELGGDLVKTLRPCRRWWLVQRRTARVRVAVASAMGYMLTRRGDRLPIA